MAKTKKTVKKSVKKKASVVKKKARVVKKKAASGKKRAGLTQITYTVSDELQAVVGGKKLTRPKIIKQLWVYIKAHKCQDTKNKRMINPDQKLSAVLGKKPVDMLKMAGLLNKHIKK